MGQKLGLDVSLEGRLRDIKKYIDNREPDAEELRDALVSLLDLLIERESLRQP